MTHDPSQQAMEDAASQSGDLHRLVWQLNRRMRAETQPAAEVPLGHQSVLALLDHHPGMTSAELARAEFVRPQSMNSTVAALRALGHVSTTESATDGRRQELHLTASGRKVLTRIRSLRGDWLTACLAANLTEDERETVRQATQLIRRATQDAPHPGADQN